MKITSKPMLPVLLVFALAISLAFAGEDGALLRVALLPPADFSPTTSAWEGMSGRCGFEWVAFSPDTFVSDGSLNASDFPLAVYAGGERYCHTVERPGDGITTVIRYLEEGGVLLVAGMCWPFYRPVDYVDGKWVPSRGALPEFKGDPDPVLAEQMARFSQDSSGNFNRFLGINIAGEGTRQFERPDEKVHFERCPAASPLFDLPDAFPFPVSGDQRYRPASVRHTGEGWKATPIITLKGSGGTEYGPGIIVAAPQSPTARGRVIYVWGTLFGTEYADEFVRGVLRLTMSRVELPGDLRAELDAHAKRHRVLGDRLKSVEQAVHRLSGETPFLPYLRRQLATVRGLLAPVPDALLVGNASRSGVLLAEASERFSRLSERVRQLESP